VHKSRARCGPARADIVPEFRAQGIARIALPDQDLWGSPGRRHPKRCVSTALPERVFQCIDTGPSSG
jgi:hypothetical protein